MKFHPGKCQLIRLTNQKDSIQTVYNIYGIELESFDSVEYLGVRIDSKLLLILNSKRDAFFWKCVLY